MTENEKSQANTATWRSRDDVGESKKTSSKERVRYHHGDLRQALVAGALELISEGDVRALSLRALARKVGVSYAAPYHHFSDKGELLAELAIDGYEKLYTDMCRYQTEVQDDPADFLLAAGRAYLFFAVSHPSHYRVMFGLAHAEDHPGVKNAAEKCFDRLLGNVRAVVGPDHPEIATQELANMIWSTVHGAATLWNDGLMGSHLGEVELEAYVAMITGQMCQLISALAEKLHSTP